MLEESGIDPDRFALEWVSSAEGPRFAEVVTRFTEKIRALGPHASRNNDSLSAANEAPEDENNTDKVANSSKGTSTVEPMEVTP